MDELTKEEKKQLLLKKFKPKEFNLDDIKKFGVFWRPAMMNNFQWNLVTKCDTEEEALEEIRWRAEYHKDKNFGTVLKHDPRFKTFEDETLHVDENGKVYEPTDKDMSNEYTLAKGGFFESMPEKKDENSFKTLAYYSGLELEYRGEFTILPIWEIE